MKHLLYFVVIAAAMLLLSQLLPGFEVTGWVPALLGALVLAFVNTLVKPILFVLTLPFTIITLGLFLFVLNAACLWIASLVVPGFRISNIVTALLASILLSLVGMIWKAVTRETKQEKA
ncbi:MAG: phage holin family protein [Candidatus Eisenbacteria bacterium]|uniref:Phage holin family protein n=1 Tax=Eiseniibacteriota bacterium TaxID=2212470 RepID=A0A849SRT9_UNCEI|nr:phage holin family protein [Candidatus Eisenbacteria bacterium]